MRLVLVALFLLAAAGLVDSIWFDGTYRMAVVDKEPVPEICTGR
jgi:hypothetical protein